MPSTRIDAAIRQYSPEQIQCWFYGQSLESRYSSASGAGLGKLIGQAILRRRLSQARRADSVRMPRFPVVAAGATHIFIFDGPVPTRGPFATLQRDQVEIFHGGGLVWRRLDIVARAHGTAREYTVMRLGLFGGAKQLRTLVDELAGSAGQPLSRLPRRG